MAEGMLIDNSKLRYLPVQLRCGIRVHCRPDVLARCPLVLQDLHTDLQACLDILPTAVHALVKRTIIWVNTTYYYGPKHKPKHVNHTTAHHYEEWLLWVRDKKEKARGIEIYNCFDYQTMRHHWQGSGLILHELCHLFHQLVLPDGLKNQVVKDAYKQAKQGGLYDKILRRDWAGLECEHDMAYAMVNHKEFFAELSVTYLSDAYHSLDGADRTCMGQCSPPLVSSVVVRRVKQNLNVNFNNVNLSPNSSTATTVTTNGDGYENRNGEKHRLCNSMHYLNDTDPNSSSSTPTAVTGIEEEDDGGIEEYKCISYKCHPFFSYWTSQRKGNVLFTTTDTTPTTTITNTNTSTTRQTLGFRDSKIIKKIKLLCTGREATRNGGLRLVRLPHCNKFFPFTKGQLKKHDDDTWQVFSQLWSKIEQWEDQEDNNNRKEEKKKNEGCGFGCWPTEKYR